MPTHADNRWMYRVNRNQAAAAYSSLFFFFFFFIFLSPIFKQSNFRHDFLRNYEAYKVETWYTMLTMG